MKTVLFVILSVLLPGKIYSQGPPITTETPVMLGLEGNGVRTFGKLISKENTTIYVQPIGIPYNITPTFQVGGILPYKFISPKGAKTVNGFGDITVFAKYQLYKKDGKAKTFRILGLVKQTFPTGKTKSNPAVGAGLSQTFVGVVIGRLNTKVGMYTDFGYNFTSNGAPDNTIYNFSVGVPLLPHKYPQKQLNMFLEFNGNYVFDSKIHTFFISPGLQFIPGRRILFETSFQIPVIQDNIATDKTKFIILLGTRFLFS